MGRACDEVVIDRGPRKGVVFSYAVQLADIERRRSYANDHRKRRKRQLREPCKLHNMLLQTPIVKKAHSRRNRTRSDSLPETNTNRAACPKIRAARFLLTPAAVGNLAVCALHSRSVEIYSERRNVMSCCCS